MKKIRYLLVVMMMLGCLVSGIKPVAAFTSGINLAQGSYLVLANEDSFKWSPDVAYDSNHDRYLVVWEVWWPNGHHSIYGRLVTPSGLLSSEFVVFDDVYNSKQPAVAYDKTHDRYLVVWSYDSAGNDLDYDIYGRFISWYGPDPNESAFGVDESQTSTDKPRLAYSPTSDEFLIVWKVEANPSYIAGGIIYHDKTGIPVAISSGPEVRDFPDVAYNQAVNDFLGLG